MNTFMNQLKEENNYKYTENGGLAYKSTMNQVYDLFAFGAAYRQRSDEDCILLFKKAFEENEELALKCLFYIRDCRGGQGERRFFRVCMKWLAENHSEAVRRNLEYISEYGRWDDLYILVDTPLEGEMFELVKLQLERDMSDVMNGTDKTGISLLAKWLKSENASSKETKMLAKRTREYLGISASAYRKTLSRLREHIKVLEKLMSANRWDEIDFSKIPSRAGLIYKNAFARRDIIAEKYKAFAKDKTTKVNAGVLYPYEVVTKALSYYHRSTDETDRAMINKYWENLPDYLNGEKCSMMCVVDTSGSMTWGQGAVDPIDIAIGLGLYCAERLGGPFKNHYISFASRPQLIETSGVDFVDKVRRIYQTNLCDNTNLVATFDLLFKIAMKKGVKKEDIPKTIVVISDMEIDYACSRGYGLTEMETVRKKWETYGLEFPRLVYWNVNARNNTILDKGPSVSFVSGASPIIFKQVITGKTGWELCLETICSDRYKNIK
ncbi:MAG: DUF2828 family protein [Clostridia bacterium]|nr:DUF2828 family protein [Clostridia bacterium]